MPRVSVVIPAYNASTYVGAALTSVFAQTYRDFEVIVVDDGSEDEVAFRAVLDRWADRIVYVRQANAGPARARNEGIAKSAGELIAFLDADDVWRPDKLQKQVAYFDRHPETGLLHTGVIGQPARWTPRAEAPHDAFCDLFHTRFFVNASTVMIPAAVLAAAGGFDERRQIHVEDWDLWLRIAARYALGYLSEPLAYHRPGGLMSRQVECTYASQLLVIEKNQPLCSQTCERHRSAPARCLAERKHVLHRDWGYDRLKGGDRAGAREQFRLALRCSRLDLRTAGLYLATFAPSLNRAATARGQIGFRCQDRH